MSGLEYNFTGLPFGTLYNTIVSLGLTIMNSIYLACSDRNAFFFLQKNLKNIMHGRVKMYAMR